MKIKIILFVTILAAFAHNAWADITLDIDGAVSRAVENNLSLERSRADVDAARRGSERSWSSLLPSLNVGAQASRPTSITDEITSPADEWKAGFSIQAGITLSPAIFANVAQTKAEYEAGLLNYESARQNLDYQVRALFYQLLLLQENMDLAEQSAASAEISHGQTLARRNAGQASNLDELSARLDVQNQQIAFDAAKINYENAIDNLKHLLMIPEEETVILAGSLLNLAVTEDGAGLDNAALSSNESLETGVLRKSIEVLETQRASAQASSYAPSLAVSWNSTPMYSGSTGKWTDTGQLSISLSMKLDNFLPWSQASESINNINDAIATQESLLLESSLNHQNTLYKLKRNITQSTNTIEALRLNVTLAEETYASYEESYQSGGTDFQTLNTARDNLQAARNKLLSEQYNLALAVLELEKEVNVPFGSVLRLETP
jgi:outer membrane protein TolC